MTRSAQEIAAGLAPSRPGRPIEPGTRIHVLGVGGAATAGAALHAHAAGAIVTACDLGGPDPVTAAVLAAGIPIDWRHDAGHIIDSTGVAVVDRLAVTKAVTSVQPDHPELLAARMLGIEPESVQQLIADAAATGGRRLIAVTGTHGKSTTSGWLLHLLVGAGRDPSGFVGAVLPSSVAGPVRGVARFGAGEDFVVEADEYAGNFDPYRPAVTILISAEWDHPDVFSDAAGVETAFADWIRRAAETDDRPGREPILVANVGDAGVRGVLDRLDGWPGRVVRVRLLDDEEAWPTDLDLAARALAEDGDGSTLELRGGDVVGGVAGAVDLGLVGRHMAIDGLLAAAGALVVGAEPAAVLGGLASFRGVERRFELKGEVDGVTVLDDYAHHPTAMQATFAAARRRYPGRRLWAVYEPLTYHRTAAMLEPFAEILAMADRAAIIDIWAVRDPDTTITSAAALAEAVSRRALEPAQAIGDPEAAAAWLADHVEPGDVVLIMGGGRSYVAAERLVERLRDRSAEATGSR